MHQSDRVCLSLMTFGRCRLGHVDWATCLLGADIQLNRDLKVSIAKMAIFLNESAKCQSIRHVGSHNAVYYEVMIANFQVTFEKSIDICENQKEVPVCQFRDKTGGHTSIIGVK